MEGVGIPPAGPFCMSGVLCLRPACRSQSAGEGIIVSIMASVAAFFDLDRTVLRGASGPAINDALSATGLRSTNIPGEALIYRIYNLFGENLLGMALARAAAFGVKGWQVDEMEEAGEMAAERLEALVGDSNKRRLLELTSLVGLIGVAPTRAKYLQERLPVATWQRDGEVL